MYANRKKGSAQRKKSIALMRAKPKNSEDGELKMQSLRQEIHFIKW